MKVAIVWHQKDLRTEWNPALSAAAEENDIVIPLYIDDEKDALGGASRWWLHRSLKELDKDYRNLGASLVVHQGSTLKILQEVINQSKATTLYYNLRYEPKHHTLPHQLDISIKTFNGNHLIDPKAIEVSKGKPYSIFTPFYKACLKEFDPQKKPSPVKKLKSLPHLSHFPKFEENHWMEKLDQYWKPGRKGALKQLDDFTSGAIKHYQQDRDFPGIEGTSSLSPHLHFGELSPFEVWEATKKNEGFVRQLFWREFGTYFLFHFPKAETQNWNKKFDDFPWKYNKKDFEKWTKGLTGFPIVDAGMRQLWETGWMHNRVRMIVASFLIKDLLIDWKKGEKWFWDTLVDADKGNNILGWQWVAGSGPDAAPYFRIFNPTLQSKKFDPDGEYIRSWVPELAKLSNKHIHEPSIATAEDLEEAGIILGKTYPHPMVDHAEARKKALEIFHNL